LNEQLIRAGFVTFFCGELNSASSIATRRSSFLNGLMIYALGMVNFAFATISGVEYDAGCTAFNFGYGFFCRMRHANTFTVGIL